MSEYLSEEEQVARMKSWWDEYGTTVIVSVVVALAAAFGWTWYSGYSDDRIYAASTAYEAYNEAGPEQKAAAAATLAEQFPGSAYHVLTLFDQAQAALDEGDPAAAEGFLNQVVASADDPLLVDLARIRLAKVQHAQDRATDALNTLAAIRNEGYRAWALEAKGDIHVSRSELQLAHEAYTAAVESLGEGAQRPLLEMKLNNVAPTNGEYVPFTDTLADALKAAQQTLDTGAVAQPQAAPETAEAEASSTAATAASADSGAETAPAAPAERVESQDE